MTLASEICINDKVISQTNHQDKVLMKSSGALDETVFSQKLNQMILNSFFLVENFIYVS